MLLGALGEDASRPGLADTPARVGRALREALSGYATGGADAIGGAVFAELSSADAETNGAPAPAPPLVCVRDIHFASTDALTLLPFQGSASVAYVPKDGRVVGLSKAARLVDAFARRLTTPEELARGVRRALEDELRPATVAVRVRARPAGDAAYGHAFETVGGASAGGVAGGADAADVLDGDAALAGMFAGANAQGPGRPGHSHRKALKVSFENGEVRPQGGQMDEAQAVAHGAPPKSSAVVDALVELVRGALPTDRALDTFDREAEAGASLRSSAEAYVEAMLKRTAGYRSGPLGEALLRAGVTSAGDAARRGVHAAPPFVWAPPLPPPAMPTQQRAQQPERLAWHEHVALDLVSTCEHHLLPFSGVAHVGYLLAPADASDEGVVAASEEIPAAALGRARAQALVDHFATRLQVQERITEQVADALIGADVRACVGGRRIAGACVVIEAAHMCMSARGVRKPRSATVSVAVRGVLSAGGTAATARMVAALMSARTAATR